MEKCLPYVLLSTADKTLTRQHRAVAHSDHGVQSRSGGGRAEAKLYRACTSSSLISISPPPSWLGWSSGTTAGLSVASSSCRRLVYRAPALLACLLAAVQIPALPNPATAPTLFSPRTTPHSIFTQQSRQPQFAASLPLIPHSLSTNNQVSIDALAEQQPCHRARPACSFVCNHFADDDTRRSDLHLHTSSSPCSTPPLSSPLRPSLASLPPRAETRLSPSTPTLSLPLLARHGAALSFRPALSFARMSAPPPAETPVTL